MNFELLFSLAPKILPLMPEIEKAIATAQRVMADADVKAALATAEKISKIIDEEQKARLLPAEHR